MCDEHVGIVNLWRDTIPCSCLSYNPSDFGDCITCMVAGVIFNHSGYKGIMEFLDSVRIGRSDYLEISED